MTDQEILTNAYDAFNTRNIEAALATMHGEVEWPNTLEGGYVHGHAGVSDYWTKQWKLVDPHVEPLSFTTEADGRIVVEVHLVVNDLQGELLEDVMVQHIFRMEGGLIRSMAMGVDRLMTTGRG